MVQILHISDIHRAPRSPISNVSLLGKLRLDINNNYNYYNENILPRDVPGLNSPDLIIVSGDLTQTGAEDEFSVALEFLEGISGLVNNDRSRVIIVPGNHDLNWSIAAASYTQTTEDDYDNQPSTQEPYQQWVKRALDGTYWRKDETRYTERFEPFAQFFNRFYGGAYNYPLDRGSMYTIYDYKDRFGLVIVGFNSCDEIDAYRDAHGNLHSLDVRAFINTDAIHKAGQDERLQHADVTLRIAVFHHNTRSVGHKNDFLDPLYLNLLRDYRFDFCLHGHVHTASQELFFDTTTAQGLPVIGAGSLAAPYQDRPQAAPRGYNVLVYEQTTGGIWVHTRRDDETRPGWIPDFRWEVGRPFYTVRAPAVASGP